ncbi:hypothetical protein CHS0354_006849 [Potamilus streckersoni]|uniref:aminomethyltransferase n=1 Tax=Potamilus streckersoni TaxID=2493646 RepID=A0AAE0TF76_9BIVA|nr:hypothetical protein CHS0354_006849 [Potamilus streckersoni]
MADFAGWDMPIQYAGIIAEHNNTRTRVSLFDVSHMGEFEVRGADAEKFLNYATVNNIALMQIGQAQYNAILNQSGGVVDDIISYKFSETYFRLCVNAANIRKDFDHLHAVSRAFDVRLTDISERVALIAVQGPMQKKEAIVARLGYTGEDGFEIACDPEDAPDIWQALMHEGRPFGIAPAGLGARDTLRLEAEDRGIPRKGQQIYSTDGKEIGVVTSGSFSTHLNAGIGMGYLPADTAVGTRIEVRAGKRALAATVVKPPFLAKK